MAFQHDSPVPAQASCLPEPKYGERSPAQGRGPQADCRETAPSSAVVVPFLIVPNNHLAHHAVFFVKSTDVVVSARMCKGHAGACHAKRRLRYRTRRRIGALVLKCRAN